MDYVTREIFALLVGAAVCVAPFGWYWLIYWTARAFYVGKFHAIRHDFCQQENKHEQP